MRSCFSPLQSIWFVHMGFVPSSSWFRSLACTQQLYRWQYYLLLSLTQWERFSLLLLLFSYIDHVIQRLPAKRNAEPQQHLWQEDKEDKDKENSGPCFVRGVCRAAAELHLNSWNILYTASKCRKHTSISNSLLATNSFTPLAQTYSISIHALNTLVSSSTNGPLEGTGKLLHPSLITNLRKLKSHLQNII